MTDDTSTRPVDTLIREQARRLFSQRVYLITHFTVFTVAIILTRGTIARLGIIFAAWAVIMLGHFLFYALYEYRETVIRESYRKRKNREHQHNHNQVPEDVFYTIDEDDDHTPSPQHTRHKRR